MKTFKSIALLAVIMVMSCGKGASKQTANAKGFTAIETEIKSKFGDNAYYTELTISYNKSIGNSISVIATESPESLKMGEWYLTLDTWKQNSEITLEVPQGSKASEFMFQLDDNINLTQLGELVEKSSDLIKAESSSENPTLYMAYIKLPKNGDLSKTEYIVLLNSEDGENTYTFIYKLNDQLIQMDY